MENFDRAKLATDNTLLFWCPGCDSAHGISVNNSSGWQWNGSLERPTISPSILVRQILYGPNKLTFNNYKGEHPPSESCEGICHSFIKDGRIEFLNDCTHHLKGQTVDLPVFDLTH